LISKFFEKDRKFKKKNMADEQRHPKINVVTIFEKVKY